MASRRHQSTRVWAPALAAVTGLGILALAQVGGVSDADQHAQVGGLSEADQHVQVGGVSEADPGPAGAPRIEAKHPNPPSANSAPPREPAVPTFRRADVSTFPPLGPIRWKAAEAGLAIPAPAKTHPNVVLAEKGQNRKVVQFQHLPSRAERAALEAAGVKLLRYIGSNAFFANVKGAPPLALAPHRIDANNLVSREST